MGRITGTTVTVVFLAAYVAAPLLQVDYSSVLTGSMRPAFVPGDLLITVPKAVTDLQPGQVVLFTPPGETNPYVHRITAIAGSPERPVLTTKGDANPAPDKWRARLDQAQVPVVVAIVPSLGSALLWAQNPIQRAIFSLRARITGLRLSSTVTVSVEVARAQVRAASVTGS